MGKKSKEGVALIQKPKAPEGACRCCGIKIAIGEVARSEPGYCFSCSQKSARARTLGMKLAEIYA